MCEREAMHGMHRLLTEMRYLFPFLLFDKRTRNHPASSTCNDVRLFQVVSKVVYTDSACRHEFHSRKRCTESLKHRQPSRGFCREEFHDGEVSCHSLLDLTRVVHSRVHRDSLFLTECHDIMTVAG